MLTCLIYFFFLFFFQHKWAICSITINHNNNPKHVCNILYYEKLTFNTLGWGSPYDLYLIVDPGAPVLVFFAFGLSLGLVICKFESVLSSNWGLSLSFKILDLTGSIVAQNSFMRFKYLELFHDYSFSQIFILHVRYRMSFVPRYITLIIGTWGGLERLFKKWP